MTEIESALEKPHILSFRTPQQCFFFRWESSRENSWPSSRIELWHILSASLSSFALVPFYHRTELQHDTAFMLTNTSSNFWFHAWAYAFPQKENEREVYSH